VANPVKAGTLAEFEDGEPKVFIYPGAGPVAVIQTDGQFYAFSNFCTHEGAALAHGYGDFYGNKVFCLKHNASFDMGTGQVLGGAASDPLQTFAVRIEGDDVLVEKR